MTLQRGLLASGVDADVVISGAADATVAENLARPGVIHSPTSKHNLAEFGTVSPSLPRVHCRVAVLGGSGGRGLVIAETGISSLTNHIRLMCRALEAGDRGDHGDVLEHLLSRHRDRQGITLLHF